MFTKVSLIPSQYPTRGDRIRWEGIEGTVVDFIPHAGGFSLWVKNATDKSVEGIEWIFTGETLPAIERKK